MTPEHAAAMVRRWFDAALTSVDPEHAVEAHLARTENGVSVTGTSIVVPGKVIVIAIGKAAVPMARAAERQLGARVANGVALTKNGHVGGSPLSRILVREASHPIPDERGVAATKEILDLVASVRDGDLVLALISGGGSALFEAPVEGVTLADIAATTDLLLKSGAPIQDLNAVRIPLSRVKGGGLRAAAPQTKFATLILSDVLGNDPAVIASGPTRPSEASGKRALDLLAKYGVAERTPQAVIAALEVVRPKTVDASNDLVAIVADNKLAVQAMSRAAEQAGRGGTHHLGIGGRRGARSGRGVGRPGIAVHGRFVARRR